MIRHNHIIHNHRTIKKTAHLLMKPFGHIPSQKLKHIAFALIFLLITGSVVRNIYVSMVKTRKVLSYSLPQIKSLKKTIESNEAWILFNQHFPDLISSPSLPNYFQSGLSYPRFFVH